MSKLAAIQALAAQAAQTGPNMTEAEKGGGGGRLLPEGYAFARLVEYVEYGAQPQEYLGQAKDPADEVQLGFALWGVGYQNEDGTPYIVRPFSFAVSRNEKAKAFKLFKLLNWRGTATHFAQLLSEAWLLKIVHVPKDKTQPNGPKVSRVAMDGFLPPLDPVTKAQYQIPEAPDDLYRVFLWDYPSKESWDALYIDGNYDDGKSKNVLQQKILSAVNFAGSPLEVMLGGSSALALPTPSGPVVPQANPTVAAPVAVPSGPAVVTPPASGSPVPSASPATTSPSSPVMPVIPSMPALPSIPAVPA